MQFEVDAEKAAQALNYFARKQHDHVISKLAAIKLVFFADRYHLRRYGRPVVGDTYYAMPLGPVASTVLAIADATAGAEVQSYASAYISSIPNPNGKPREIRSLREVDPDVFSRTDLEALEFAYDTFWENDPFRMVDVTHVYPEWRKHEATLASDKGSRRQSMDYADFFSDPDPELLKEIGVIDPYADDLEALALTKELAEDRSRARIFRGASASRRKISPCA